MDLMPDFLEKAIKSILGTGGVKTEAEIGAEIDKKGKSTAPSRGASRDQIRRSLGSPDPHEGISRELAEQLAREGSPVRPWRNWLQTAPKSYTKHPNDQGIEHWLTGPVAPHPVEMGGAESWDRYLQRHKSVPPIEALAMKLTPHRKTYTQEELNKFSKEKQRALQDDARRQFYEDYSAALKRLANT